MGFIDLEKAFDTVPRSKLWKILSSRGINSKIIRIIRKIYENNTNAVIFRGMKSDTFKTEEGLRQGGRLSPLLFIIFMDEIIKNCKSKTPKIQIGYKNMQPIEISEGAFAGDIILTPKGEKELQIGLNIWNKTLTDYGMKMNKNKTKVMVIGEEERINIKIEDTPVDKSTTSNI